jgi:hypothetical protein
VHPCHAHCAHTINQFTGPLTVSPSQLAVLLALRSLLGTEPSEPVYGSEENPPLPLSTARLRSVARRPPAASQPGDLPGGSHSCERGRLVLGRDSRLDAFSGSPHRTWLPSGAGCPTTGSPAVRPARSSRTRASPPQPPNAPAADRDRTVSRRSEPSSRTAFMGEQPNPWDLLQPQDATSRHRGAKPCRRYGLLGRISLLSPG